MYDEVIIMCFRIQVSQFISFPSVIFVIYNSAKLCLKKS